MVNMGSTLTDDGVSFRVWAPNATAVAVFGDFNSWEEPGIALSLTENGVWEGNSAQAHAGSAYKYIVTTSQGNLHKTDPCSKELSDDGKNTVVHNPSFDWGDESPTMVPWNELVIYEVHIGTFNAKEEGKLGNFDTAAERIGYLKALGVNAIEIMPPTHFPGPYSWGYNPSQPYAIATQYGGPQALKAFVKAAHAAGISVILDIVYNHFGPGELDLWQFDGWSINNGGGIYFYQDERAKTPWGENRPDYGREEVRRYILDNALMWFDEYKIDGLRLDAIAFVRNIDGEENPEKDLPDGWSLMKWLNESFLDKFPGRITIAEDLKGNEWITKRTEEGGEGFSTQWDATFVYILREALKVVEDKDRDMHALVENIVRYFNDDAFQRVIFTESHDTDANGAARLNEEISPGSGTNFYAKKKSILGLGVVMTAPGIPMIFQGQEFMEGGSFSDTQPINWGHFSNFKGITRLYRDLIKLRTNAQGFTKGLTGQHTHVLQVDHDAKIIVIHRFDEEKPRDSTVVIYNFAQQPHEDYPVAFPSAGVWKVRFNSDWNGYDPEFTGMDVFNTDAEGPVALPPYGMIIWSQD